MPCIFAEKWHLIFKDLQTAIFRGFGAHRNRVFFSVFLKLFSILPHKNAGKNILAGSFWGRDVNLSG